MNQPVHPHQPQEPAQNPPLYPLAAPRSRHLLQPPKDTKGHTSHWMMLPLGSPDADKTLWSRSCRGMLPVVTLLQPLQKPFLNLEIVSLTYKTSCALLCQLTLPPQKKRNAASVLRSWQALGPSRSSSHQIHPLPLQRWGFKLTLCCAMSLVIGEPCRLWGSLLADNDGNVPQAQTRFFSKEDGPAKLTTHKWLN